MGQSECKPECKPCSHSDPATDTVTVNPHLLSELGPNSDIAALEAKEVAWLQHEAESRRAGERQLQQEREQHDESNEAERRRLEDMTQRERREKEQALHAAKEEEEDGESVDEEEAMQARSTLEAAEKEQLEAQNKVDIFLHARGFKSVTAPRKKCCDTSYPLHVAVQENSVEMVRALVRCGGNPSQKNSASKTPLQVARRLNKKGSHDLVLSALIPFA